MRKFLLIIFLLIYAENNIFSKNVDSSLAKSIALNFLNKNFSRQKNKSLNNEIKLNLVNTCINNTDNKSLNQQSLYYIFNIENDTGFVIISGDDETTPILGYSFEDSYNSHNLPPAFVDLMNFYKMQISYIKQNNLSGDKSTRDKWMNLKSLKNLTTTYVGPWDTLRWNQSPYYNDMCPFDIDSNKRTVTGCVATAMAQIMRYWQYPDKGVGDHSYYCGKYGILSANFDTTRYNWNSMPKSVRKHNNAVATIMFHCGVSVNMFYGVDQSGINSIQTASDAFKNYFHYNNNIKFISKQSYSESDWINLLKNELDNKRPVLYSGLSEDKKSGHAFVCNGYDSDDMFHFNWGWSGYLNGYFTVSDLSPDPTLVFSYNQCAVTGIYPDSSISFSDKTLNVGPNPWNQVKDKLNLKFQLSKPQNVEINIIDIFGRKLETIINQYETEGPHDLIWNKKLFKSGIYFVQFKGIDTKTIKIIII